MRSNELKASLTTEGPGCSMKTAGRISSMPSRCRRKNELPKRYELSATEDKPKVYMKWKSKAIWGIVSVISVQIFIYGSYHVHNKGFAPQLSSLPSPTAVHVGGYDFVGCSGADNIPDFCCGPRTRGHTVATCAAACAEYEFFALQPTSGWCACNGSYASESSHHDETDPQCTSSSLVPSAPAAKRPMFRRQQMKVVKQRPTRFHEPKYQYAVYSHRTGVWMPLNASSGCGLNEDGVPRRETRIREITADLADCINHCNEHRGCIAVDYFRNTSWCHFFDRACISPRDRHDGASSYMFFTGCESRHGAGLEPGSFIHGPESGLPAPSELHCSYRCAFQELCTAWVYSPGSKICWWTMQTSGIEFVAASDRISGPRCSLGCDSGWAHSEGRCFKYFAAARSFLEAEAACQTAHAMAHLATIESAAQNAVAYDLIEGSAVAFIGLWSGSAQRCSTDASTWQWTSTGTGVGHGGTPYSNWINQEWNPPDCHLGPQAGHAAVFNCDWSGSACRPTSLWEDSSMQDKLPYICSYLLEVVPAMLSPVTLPPTKDLASTMVPTATDSTRDHVVQSMPMAAEGTHAAIVDQKRYVMKELKAGLGNQLFQWSAANCIAKKNQRYLCVTDGDFDGWFDGPFYQNCDIPYASKNLTEAGFAKFDANITDLRAFTSAKTVQLNGYFQSFRYFEDCLTDVRSALRFKWPIDKKAMSYVQRHLDNDRPWVGIHVRRGDKIAGIDSNRHYFPARSYFERSMAHFRAKFPSVQFVVVSDEPQWCLRQPYFKAADVHIVEEDHLDAIEMAILTKCQHMILTIGTFGWWSAWLGAHQRNGDVIYYAFENNMGKEIYHNGRFTAEDYYPPTWLKTGTLEKSQLPVKHHAFVRPVKRPSSGRAQHTPAKKDTAQASSRLLAEKSGSTPATPAIISEKQDTGDHPLRIPRRRAYLMTQNREAQRAITSREILERIGFEMVYPQIVPNADKVLSNKLTQLQVYHAIANGTDPWGYVFEDDIALTTRPFILQRITQGEVLGSPFVYLGVCAGKDTFPWDQTMALEARRQCGRCAHAYGISRRGASMLLKFDEVFGPGIAEQRYMDVVTEAWCKSLGGFPVLGHDFGAPHTYPDSYEHTGLFFQDRAKFASTIS
ncbi:hypothetical protein CYMTET_44953 [Cymbomonas tetramitiformis]|uniref:C-type lectin domain-containing protein n=1 Tax=Cymbomonas tetramitiformis TaxID=36881 RepID=A0AAE0C0E6_9CHLO|nr:hypothetical protein CYMTET_44953 [Cymbomonas tetramitiformis]